MNCVVYGCYRHASEGERVCPEHAAYLGITGRNIELATLRARLHEVEAERDGAVERAGDKERAEHRALARLRAEKAALRAERDRMRPVVEAAVEWISTSGGDARLMVAIEEYRVSTPKEPRK